MRDRAGWLQGDQPPRLPATVIPQVTQPERPAIPQVVNFNFYGTGSTMAARAIRQAIPGTAGDATQQGVTAP